MPAPNVDSAVIRLEVKHQDRPLSAHEEFLFGVVKAAFSQRRKTLANPVSNVLGISKSKITEALIKAGLKPSARAEELTFEQWLSFADLLLEIKES